MEDNRFLPRVETGIDGRLKIYIFSEGKEHIMQGIRKIEIAQDMDMARKGYAIVNVEILAQTKP
jgi:hypothetical protein